MAMVPQVRFRHLYVDIQAGIVTYTGRYKPIQANIDVYTSGDTAVIWAIASLWVVC